MKNKSILKSTLACLVAITIASSANAQNFLEKNAETIKPYITSDVVAIAYVDLENFDFDKTMEFATQIGLGDGDKLEGMKQAGPEVKAGIKTLADFGFTCAIGLVRTTDISHRGVSWVMPIKEGADPRTAAKLIVEPLAEMPWLGMSEFDSGDGVVFASASKQQLLRLKTERAQQPRELADSIKTCGGGTAGLIVFGDPDSRRVVRELLPVMPKPIEALTGTLIADELDWIGVQVDLSEDIGAMVTAETKNETAASTIAEVAKLGISMLEQIPVEFEQGQLDYLQQSLAPVQENNRVVISMAKLMEDRPRLKKALGPFVTKAKGAAAQTGRLRSLRMIALAMHNYESVFRHFPTQAIVDEAGKPLLSWRVQILPFLEQNDLYEQFHLNEPWDSEHNLKLVEKMPALYQDSNRENNKAGKTIYQVATGEGLMFDGGNEISYRKMIDGTSNTLMAICVAQKHAAIWTQPDDWQVDFAKPMDELEEAGREFIEFILADGSAQSLPVGSGTEKQWEYLIKHDDAEVTDISKFEMK